jgi:hypothetical protein
MRSPLELILNIPSKSAEPLTSWCDGLIFIMAEARGRGTEKCNNSINALTVVPRLLLGLGFVAIVDCD